MKASDQPDAPRPRRRKRYGGKYPHRPDERYKELAPEKYPGIHDHVREQGRTPAGTHVPNLVAEVMAALRPAAGETVVDCTVGYGGHAVEFLKRIGPAGRLIGFDVDGPQLERTRRRLAQAYPDATLLLRRGNFAGVDRALAELGLDAADVIFADLGASSVQVDDPARGFSYKFDGPLDMRMDDRLPRTAADWLRTLSETDLAAALSDLADEPDAAAIARRAAEERQRKPITRTLELVQLVFGAKGIDPRAWRRGRTRRGCGMAGLTGRGGVPGGDAGATSRSPLQDDLHPAARTFQALRILVNDELSALRQLLRVAPACLRPGGRIGILSFHSGEDRLVKHAFREGLAAGVYAAISAEVTRPTHEEVRANPRSAAAKLRWAVRT